MFFIGFFTGIVTALTSGFFLMFYNKSERKDKLLANLQGKDFEEKITLKERNAEK